MTTSVSFQSSQGALATVSEDMFGGNFLIDRDRIGTGTYDEAVRDLGLRNLRYPGGTVTEWFFDINDPDKTTGWDPERQDWRDLLPLSEFLSDAASLGCGVNLVIPTGNLLADGTLGTRTPSDTAYDDVYRFVRDVLAGEYGDAEITALEIGNEYWLGGEMDVTEYAQVASVIGEAAQAAIDDLRAEGLVPEDWIEPEIAIQRGQYGKYSTENGWVQNDYLINNITDAAADAIDAVVTHYYASGPYENLENTDYRFAYLEDWVESGRFGDLEFHVTEWNVAGNDSPELGMRGASALLWIFSEMVLEGVDAAYAWPVQQTTLITLTGNEGDDSLTIAGETFRLLSDSVSGMDLMARHDYGTGHIYVYEDCGRTVVMIASREEIEAQVELDLAALGLEGFYYKSTSLGTLGALDDPDAAPILSIQDDYTQATPTALFDVDAYGVVRIVFETGFASGSLGTDGNDVLTGSADNDSLEGFAGDDRLFGCAGEDLLLGGDGDDIIDGGDHGDVIVAGAGNDTVYGGNGQDDVDLGDGNDVFWDNLQGGIWGMDTVRGGAGNDEINGGGGDDVFYGDQGDDVIDGSGGLDEIAGGDGLDRITGGSGNDTLSGNDGDDELNGDGGDDLLDGGDDNDKLNGGDGDDTLVGGAGSDRVYGQAGNDRIEGGTERDYLFGGGGTDEILGEAGDDRMYGESGNDVLDGGNGADRLYGDDGNDRLTGGLGDDYLDGGAGADTLIGGRGKDRMHGGTEDDTLMGYADVDYLYGGDGIDRLWGGDGRDVLFGDAGDDFLYGEDGADKLDGGEGNDMLDAGIGVDKLYGRDGDDTLEGGAGADYLYGNNDNDTLRGGADDDRLFGGSGNDLIEGGEGADYIDGGTGNDVIRGGNGGGWLYGGTGDDVFVFDGDDSQHNIYDFADGDMIRIEGAASLEDLSITTHGNGNVEINYDDTRIMLFEPTATVDAGDFLFG